LVIRNFRGTCSYNEMPKGYMAVESLGILVLNLNIGDRLKMKMLVALVDSYHGSLISAETRKAERWQNGKMERTAAKIFVIRL